uniref:Uncharacterized protein n=1 Tax=Rhizophagus irregularis (strain DAOM 181602 / DAOM 197198 / MUCL 43194) TaxID=747089 RepID=U9USK4_RHIID
MKGRIELRVFLCDVVEVPSVSKSSTLVTHHLDRSICSVLSSSKITPVSSQVFDVDSAYFTATGSSLARNPTSFGLIQRDFLVAFKSSL